MVEKKPAASKPAAKKKKVAKPVTLAELLGKPKRTGKFEFRLEDELAYIEFSAMSAKDFDDLTAAHPPTPAQKADNYNWNVDTMYQPLIAACAIDPVLTLDEATQFIESDSWSFGELNSMYRTVVNLNTSGASVSFT